MLVYFACFIQGASAAVSFSFIIFFIFFFYQNLLIQKNIKSKHTVRSLRRIRYYKSVHFQRLNERGKPEVCKGMENGIIANFGKFRYT